MKKRSVLRHAFISYAGTVLLLTVVIGIVSIHITSDQIEALMREYCAEQMTSAADDIQNQISIMNNIAFSVKTSPYYRKNYVSRNNYFELDLIEDFSKYSGYTPLTRNYYLLNRENGVVYSSAGKYSYDMFVKYVLKMETASMQELFCDSIAMQIVRVGDDILIALPLSINGFVSSDMDHCLIFRVSEAALNERVESIAGRNYEKLAVCYDGNLILGQIDAQGGQERAFSSDGRIQMLFEPDWHYGMASLSGVRRLLVAMTVVAAIGGAVMAICAAWRSYQPIYDLMKRLNLPGYRGAENEVMQIEKMVDCMRNEAYLNQELLHEKLTLFDEQGAWLRQQTLTMLLCGQGGGELVDMLDTAGVRLPFELFCVLICRREDREPLSEELIGVIESMTDEQACFYPVRLPEFDGCAVLMNTSCEERAAYACWLLREAGLALDIPLTVRAGSVVDDMKRVQESLVLALSNEQAQNVACGARSPERRETLYDENEMNVALACVKRGDAEGAVEHLQTLIDGVDKSESSEVMRRLIYSDVINRLILCARCMNVSVPVNVLNTVYVNVMHHASAAGFEQVVYLLAEEAKRNEPEPTDAQQEDVLRHIAAHMGDTQLDAEQIGEKFHMSVRQVRQLIKDATGMNYREYIIFVRLNEAKRLLSESDLTVAEIGEKVGYANLSYFIRSFKAETGYSPGEYRKSMS